jgi:hypothetical protein
LEEEITLGDSCLISKYLTEHGMIQDLNEAAHLGPKDRALDAAVRALMEDKLYFFNVSLISSSYILTKRGEVDGGER